MGTDAGQRIPLPLRDVEIDERIPLKKREKKFQVFIKGEDGRQIEVNPEPDDDPKGKGKRRPPWWLKGKGKGKGKGKDKGKDKGKSKGKGRRGRFDDSSDE